MNAQVRGCVYARGRRLIAVALSIVASAGLAPATAGDADGPAAVTGDADGLTPTGEAAGAVAGLADPAALVPPAAGTLVTVIGWGWP